MIDEPHLGLGVVVRTSTPTAPPALALVGTGGAPGLSLHAAIDQLKHERITRALETTKGNWAEAARTLGLDRGNFHRLARRLGFAVSRNPCATTDET